MFNSPPPLGLYIHLPWCVQKCPYCDFNSHAADSVPESDYVDALLDDLAQDLPLVWGRRIETLFIGGGTPSLFSAEAIDRLLSGVRALINFAPMIEITLESNPGSADAANYRGYREAGVNRLSIGVQSFADAQLTRLGRVHDSREALHAFELARAAGFDNINIDLMFALPEQDVDAALGDIDQALALAPEHLSHYQLTLEPNTLFHHQPPSGLPDNDRCHDLQLACQQRLAENGYVQYEVSAFARDGLESRHNLNYWCFGDYLGIGAGAHGKITLPGENRILRRQRTRHPRVYLQQQGESRIARSVELDEGDRCFEFMLNALRLRRGFAPNLFHDNTGLGLERVLPTLKRAQDKGLLHFDSQKIVPSELGYRHLNSLQEMFLELESPKNQPFFEASG